MKLLCLIASFIICAHVCSCITFATESSNVLAINIGNNRSRGVNRVTVAFVFKLLTARKTTNCKSRHRQTNNNLFHGSDFRQQKYNFFINA